MRHISLTEGDKIPPRNEEFNFKSRAHALVEKWQRIASVAATNGSAEGANGTEGIVGDSSTAAIGGEKGDVTMAGSEPNGPAPNGVPAATTNGADTEMKVDDA